MINTVSDAVTNVSQKYVSCIGRGMPQGHDNKISRPSTSFMITRSQLELKNH